MIEAITKQEVAGLSEDQQRAILEALYLAVGIDQSIGSEEQTKFREVAESIPWTLGSEALQKTLVAARDRIASTTEQEAFLAWIKSIAAQIPESLQVKVVKMMTTLAMLGDFNRNERGLLNAFVLEFKLPEDVIADLKKEFGRS